jgi:hypothetical protein
VGETEDAVERADREAFTREPPKTLKGQIGFLLKQLTTTTPAELGVSQRSVERYRKRRAQAPAEGHRREARRRRTVPTLLISSDRSD